MKDNPTIDRTSYEPAYIQLANILRNQISSGTFLPGKQLPSEAQLCSRYEVSPMTVRRTINLLIEQGVVSTTQGLGTFVKPLELGSSTFHLRELLNLFENSGDNKIKLLEVKIVSADNRISSHLSIPNGDRVIYLRRLLYKMNDPILYHQGYLLYDPARPVVEAEMDITALGGLFSGSGKTDLKNGELTINAITLDEKDAGLLKTEKGYPAFRLEHVFYDFSDRPLSWGWFTCRADKLQFTARVGIWDSIAK